MSEPARRPPSFEGLCQRIETLAEGQTAASLPPFDLPLDVDALWGA